MTFQHIKKNPSPLVYKLAKKLISYESRFRKICSVNGKRDLLLLGFLLTNLGFLRNCVLMKKKILCAPQEVVCPSGSQPVRTHVSYT